MKVAVEPCTTVVDEGASVSVKSCDGCTVKGCAVMAVPALVVRSITPVTAPFGTVARTSAGLEKATKAWSLVPDPAKVTTGWAAPALRFVPVLVTSVPIGPLCGLKSAMAGGCPTLVVNVTPFDVPPAVCTVTGPVTAPAGTVTLSCVRVADVTVAVTVPPPDEVKRTVLKPGPRSSERLPVIGTAAPAPPRHAFNDAS